MDGTCFDTYLSLCSPYALRPPWDVLEAPFAFRTPAASEQVLEQLLAHHDEASLLTCRLAVADADGRVQINPLLAQSDAPFIALAGPEGVSDLLAAGGCVRGERWPLFGALEDEHARQAIEYHQTTVLLTADLDDAIALRAIGLIAAPVVGLGQFDQREVELLARHYGLRARPSAPVDPLLRPPGSDESLAASLVRIKAALEAKNMSFEEFARGRPDEDAAAGCLELILVGWSPSQFKLDEPEAVRQGGERLLELARFRRIDLLETGEWRPTADDLQRIRLASERREADWLKEAVLHSLEESLETLSGPPRVVAPAAPPSPLEQLQKALANDEPGVAGRRRRQEALDRCHLAATNRMIEQLLAQADAEPDPLRCGLILQLAQLIELLRDKMASVRHSFVVPDRSDPGAKKPRRDAKITELLNIGKQILAVGKELNQCTPHRNHSWTSLAKPTISFPPFSS